MKFNEVFHVNICSLLMFKYTMGVAYNRIRTISLPSSSLMDNIIHGPLELAAFGKEMPTLERASCGFGSLVPVCCPSTFLQPQCKNCASKFSLKYFADGGTRILRIDPQNLALYGIFMRICSPVVMS